MDIQSFVLIGVEIIQPFRTSRVTSDVNQWEGVPTYRIGPNTDGKIIQHVDYPIIRTKKTHRATITVRTSFSLTLNTPEYKPKTDEDFEVYTFFAILAMSHARAFFMREAKGTPFEGDILPADYITGIRNKLVLAVSINSN